MKEHVNAKHHPNPITFGCPHCPYWTIHKRKLKLHIGLKHGADKIVIE
jgi:hypothetical protein